MFTKKLNWLILACVFSCVGADGPSEFTMETIANRQAHDFVDQASSMSWDQQLVLNHRNGEFTMKILAGKQKLPTAYTANFKFLSSREPDAKMHSAYYDMENNALQILNNGYSWQKLIGKAIKWFGLSQDNDFTMVCERRVFLNAPYTVSIFALDDPDVITNAYAYFMGVPGSRSKHKTSTRKPLRQNVNSFDDDSNTAQRTSKQRPFSKEEFAIKFEKGIDDDMPPVEQNTNIPLQSFERPGNRNFMDDFYLEASDALGKVNGSRSAAVNVSVNTSEVAGSLELDKSPSMDDGTYSMINAVNLPTGVVAGRKSGSTTIRFVAGERRLTILDIVTWCKLFNADSYSMVAYIDDTGRPNPFGDGVMAIDLTLDRPLLNKVIAHLTGYNLSSKQKRSNKARSAKQSLSNAMQERKNLQTTKVAKDDDASFGGNKYVLKTSKKTKGTLRKLSKNVLKSNKKAKAPSQFVFKPNSGNVDQSVSALKDVEKAVGGKIKPATITLDRTKKTAIVSTKENAKLKRLAGKATQGKLYVMLSGKDIYIVGHDSMTKPELFSELDAAMGRVQVESTAVVASGDKPGLMCRFKTAADAKAVAEALGLEGKQGEIESTNAIENAPEVD